MSSGDKNCNDSSRGTACCPDDDSEEDDVSTNEVPNGVNVQQILESMTTKFNNSTNKKNDNKNSSNNDDDDDDDNDNNKLLKKTDTTTENNKKNFENSTIDTSENKKLVIDNNKEKKNDLSSNDTSNDKINDNDTIEKQDSPKKFVLKFRTITETTDDGKKTKISSCESNLSLVPDELINCDKIGGVSVKIEHSNDQSDENMKKIDDEVVKNSKEVKSKKSQLQDTTNDINNKTKIDDKINNVDDHNDNNDNDDDHVDDDDEDDDSKTKKLNKIDKKNDLDVKNESENNKINNVDVPVTRKRKYACKSRALIESAPLPKRSSRRSSKEPFSVLESAMARKEKSYYTDDRKPKKQSKIKKLQKETNSKTKITRGDIKTSTPDTSYSDINSTLDNSKNSSDDDSKKLNGDFDDMPKLTPMIEQNIDTKLNNDSINNDDTDIDKPFLRPSTTSSGGSKPKRERYKGKFISKKVAKSLLLEDATSSSSSSSSSLSSSPSLSTTTASTTTSTAATAAEADDKKNDYLEESNVTAKRTRRSLMQSPSPAEGQASKPESTAITTENYVEDLLCLCQVQSQLYVTISGAGAPLYCTATDSIDDRLIGCCNEVDNEDVTMRRPSTRVPFIILCRTHKERLLRHNCCPSCGLFCTQGKFIQCRNGHQYHLDCDILNNKKSVCPHCGIDNEKSIILITMSSKCKPVYIPTRKKITKLPTAKMSLPGKGDNTMLAKRSPSLPLISPDDIKIPNITINPDKPDRFTLMSLYTAVKNNDLDKLVNILACGYNVNHIFRDHPQRTVLHLASQNGFLGCVHILVQCGAQLDTMDKNQNTPLMLASLNGKIDIIRYLIRAGCDVTLKGKAGMTALHMAAKSGYIDSCKTIITECKVPKTLVDSVDDGGWTSLIWASEFSHTDIARYLIDKKCDPLIRDSEQNIALHWSAYSGSSEITEILLNEGCDVNAVNVHGDTPLHIAARQNRYAVSVLLLARGARINEINVAGETVIDCCLVDGDTMNALKLNAKINQLTDNLLEKTPKILTNDISRGKEKNPIQCINGIDNEDKPVDFIYITENCLTSNIHIDRTITSLQSCHCEDHCGSDKCLCGNISLRCWYDEVGKLIPEFNYTDPPMLFECNPACDCNRITCNNRVVQHGVTQRFQLFRTSKKGWGIKTIRFIPKGTYVCEYVGEIISDSEADHREDDSYLFDLDNRDGETFCIDARRYGNIARFINHSCAPNLLPVRVFVEHQDLHFPRIAFFANRDIHADEELGFDYGEKFWIIKCKSFTCTCGAQNCRYSERTIQLTLDNYRMKIHQEEKTNTSKA